MNEYVYVACNPAMPEFVKIGRTNRAPSERMAELFSTEQPFPFKTLISLKVNDSKFVEEAIHNHLRHHRPSNRREFFKLTREQAIDEVLQCLTQIDIDFKIDWSHSDKTIGIDQYLKKHEIALTKEFEELQGHIKKVNLQLGEAITKKESKQKELKLLGSKPSEILEGWSSLLPLAYLPFPIGWLVWFGAFNVFSARREGIGFFCVCLLIAGAIAHNQAKEDQEKLSIKVKPWNDLETQIREINKEIANLKHEISNLEFRFNSLETSPLRLKKSQLSSIDNQNIFAPSHYKTNPITFASRNIFEIDLENSDSNLEQSNSDHTDQLQIVRETLNAIGSEEEGLKPQVKRQESKLDPIPKTQNEENPSNQVNGIRLKGKIFTFADFLTYTNSRKLEIDDLRKKGRELWVFRNKRLGCYYRDKTASELEELGFIWSNARDGWFLPQETQSEGNL
jgi:hypothetical protein